MLNIQEQPRKFELIFSKNTNFVFPAGDSINSENVPVPLNVASHYQALPWNQIFHGPVGRSVCYWKPPW